MSLDRDLLLRYGSEPSIMQRIVMETIESNNNGEVVLNDPTNPFTMLLEAATTTASNSLIEAKSIIRKKYPSLAVSSEDLYHHITDEHLKSITSQPSEVNIKFFINVLDLRLQGYRPSGATYSEITIPIGTKITVVNTTLTLLNDIVVRLYDNGSVLVEQQNNNNPIAYSDVGIIENDKYSSNNGTPFITFITKMKQVTKKTYNYSIVSSQGFNKVLDLTDNFYYAVVSYKNSKTNGSYVYINKSLNDEYIDPLGLTCYLSIYDQNVLFRIPDVYITSGLLSGNLNIDLYETKGKLYMPLNKYQVDEDYSIELGDTTASQSHAASKNVLIWAFSNDILQGGSNALSTTELRDEVIEAVVGDMEIPITNKQIVKAASEKGFSITKSLDTLTDRMYIAFRSLPEFNSELLYSRMDCIFSNFKFTLDGIKDSRFVLNMDSQIIIKSNSIFEYDKQVGGPLLITDEEYDRINKLPKENLIDELKERSLYFNPFYYVVDNSLDTSEVTVLDLDNPSVLNKKIVNKNSFFNHRVNTSQYGIWKTDKGYRFAFKIATDDNYDQLDKATRCFQVRAKLTTIDTYAYWNAKYDSNNDNWYIDIETELYFYNNSILLTNGSSTITENMYIPLDTEFEIFACSTASNLNDTTNFLKNEIWIFDSNKKYTVFTKENFTIKLGEELKYIYNKIWSSFTSRPLKTYTEDVIKVYEEDVYEPSPDKNGFRLYYNDKTNKIEYKKLHSAGDKVLDENGNPIYIQRKGFEIPGEYDIAKVERVLSLLLLEYPFLIASNSVYQNYKEQMIKALNSYIVTDLTELNSKLLEKTNIVFKSSKAITNVIISINNKLYFTDYQVNPKVVLYSTAKSNYTNQDLDMYKVTIGNILFNHLNNESIIMEDVREEIKNSLGGDIASVKITNIESSNSEIIKINNQLSKFILGKVLEFDSNKETIVKYNIELEVVYI